MDKKIEFYVDLPHKFLTIPIGILSPGGFYNTGILFNKQRKYPYAPNSLLKANAGARTIFSLPYLTCKTSFTRLQREIGEISLPSNQYDHFQLFKEIIANVCENSWEVKLIYFSENWIENILHNPNWLKIKDFISQRSLENSEHERNQFYFDISYSLMQEKSNFYVNPYLTDTIKHLLDISFGAYPGLAPIVDETLAPLKLIQHVLTYSYGMYKYYPTIIAPEYFNFGISKFPVYYSLQYPTTKLFSPKTKNTISTLKNLNDLKIILNKYKKQILDVNGLWKNSLLQEILNLIDFQFIHNNENKDIKPTSPLEIIQSDQRFSCASIQTEGLNLRSAEDAKFFRGCISLKNKTVFDV